MVEIQPEERERGSRLLLSTKLRTAAARSAIALSIGIAGGLVVALASWASKRTATHASAQAAR